MTAYESAQQTLVSWFPGLLVALVTLSASADERRVAIALHGGAGTIERSRMSEARALEYRSFLDAAITDGYKQLQAGESGLDVLRTIRAEGYAVRVLVLTSFDEDE